MPKYELAQCMDAKCGTVVWICDDDGATPWCPGCKGETVAPVPILQDLSSSDWVRGGPQGEVVKER